MIFQVIATVLALVLIFIFAINKFSRQIEYVAGEKFRALLKRFTSNPVIGTLTGTAVTSVIQSSTATTVMAVGLVNGGLITFPESLGIIFGANIGTTITSQLIALNVTAIAPFIIIFGFIVLNFESRFQKYGKSVFYFGLVFFCISLISQIVAPLATDPGVVQLLSKIHSVPLAIMVGIIVTVVLQSSSVTSGLILVLAASGFINLTQGVGMLLGANIGTTSTALLAALPMNKEAKKAAVAHTMFNILGCLLVLPFLPAFISGLNQIGGTTAQQIANMHVVFNILAAVFFLILIKPFSKLIDLIAEKWFVHIDIKKFESKMR
jgi:phosphate:Na+ symporter